MVSSPEVEAGHHSSRYYSSFTRVVQPFRLASCLDCNIAVVRMPAVLDR